jgi:peptide chain release factor 1
VASVLDPALIARLEQMTAALVQVEADMATAGPDPTRYGKLGRRHAELAPVVDIYRQLLQAEADLADAEVLARTDPDFEQMVDEKTIEVNELTQALRSELNPADPNDQKDVIVEVRAAAGGDEAAIWAGDLLRMYERYADRHGFRVESMDSTESEAGGFSKVTVAVKGRGAFARFKFEGGVHRVQRVPKTEAQGRVHTSTATVAVLPEVDEVDVELDPNDVRVDVFRSQGPGGQSVNTTDSAVRLTHEPTGLVVTCQDEKSQLQNKEKAFRILRARLYQQQAEARNAELSGARRAQVGTGERSEKIRTYNYKESRVTDHRLPLTIRRLDQVLEGDLDELVGAMAAKDEADRLAGDS